MRHLSLRNRRRDLTVSCSGEQAASMLEKQLGDLESKINSILDGSQNNGAGPDPQSLGERRSGTSTPNPTHSKSPSK
jgi:hypothetical protein